MTMNIKYHNLTITNVFNNKLLLLKTEKPSRLRESLKAIADVSLLQVH